MIQTWTTIGTGSNDGKEYIMTDDEGPRKVEDIDEVELKKGNFKLRIKDGDTEINAEINTNDSGKKKTPIQTTITVTKERMKEKKDQSVQTASLKKW